MITLVGNNAPTVTTPVIGTTPTMIMAVGEGMMIRRLDHAK
jgi:hypothetical protein